MKLHKLIVFICFFSILCGGCAKKPSPSHPQEEIPAIGDLKVFPQNLEVYANQDKPNSLLVSGEEQERLASNFINIFFGPWEMRKTSVPKRDVTPFFRKARGYKNEKDTWNQDEWDAMLANADLSTYPNRNMPGIILRQTDLRELPTHGRRFDKPTANIKDYPFDYFQYSLLWPGTPILIAHTTRDGRWHFIECPIAAGWVDSNDIAIASQSFQDEYKTLQFSALIKDKVVLPGTGANGTDSIAGIGTLLPRASTSNAVLVPIKNKDGFAGTAEIPLPETESRAWPMKVTPANIARVGNNMMGQPYGWGGTLGERDCSSMMRDLFTPFGIWLPRNSAPQARRGIVTSLSGLSPAEKKRVILNDGEPFFSLVGMRGHIALYIGQWRGEPAIFHNVWGVRIIKDGDDNERQIIGKAVVTSISPGKELKNLYLPITFTDRIRTLTRLGLKRQ